MASKDSASRPPIPARLWRTVFILILLGGAYWYQHQFGFGSLDDPSGESGAGPDPAGSAISRPSDAPSSPGVSQVNGYDRLTNCRLVDHRNNDGDSFFVRHGDREFELRLYYVDTPEKYLSDRHESQRRRVGEQARELGGISVDQAVELGQEAKAHTLGLIEGKSFTIFTKWEQVYDGERYYGFVQLPGSDVEYLCEELTEQGLARIHTKGEETPEGVSFYRFRDRLRALEKEAKAARRGAWGMN